MKEEILDHLANWIKFEKDLNKLYNLVRDNNKKKGTGKSLYSK